MTAPPPGSPGWPGGQPPVPPYPPYGYPGYPPAGYYQYPPPGYLPPGGPPPVKPGVIPLRPLSLTDVFNGAVAFIRANPKATLGLTTVIIVISSILGFLLNLAMSTSDGGMQEIAGAVTGLLAMMLATTLLAGMLTVIVARSVLGRRITAAEAWQRVRGRMPTLIGLTLLEVAAGATLVGANVLVIGGAAKAAGGVMATLVGVPLVMVSTVALAYLSTALSLAPMAVVLERKNIPDAIRRSLGLVRGRFWRIFGTLLCAGIVVAAVTGAISVPFSLAGSVLTIGSGLSAPTVGGMVIASVGQAIGQIVVTPFLAGVVTLLYVDSRMRSEAFDFTLMTASAASIDTDDIWLSR